MQHKYERIDNKYTIQVILNVKRTMNVQSKQEMYNKREN